MGSDQRASDVSKPSGPKVPTTEDMDDWELKLLGKKGQPFTPSEFKSQRDNLSIISGMSSINGSTGAGNQGGAGNGGNAGCNISLAGSNGQNGHSATSSRNNTLERPTRLLPQQTPSGHKKKIIPVHSDFESSPSPEDSPSSPTDSRDTSPVKEFINRPSPVIEEESKKKKILGKFTKTSLSFRSDKDKSSNSAESANENALSRSRAGSVLSHVGGHSRTYSDGSNAGSNGSIHHGHPTPPKGPRVVLGRETTPTEAPQKIPKDVWDKFDGKSREDLIEMIVSLQDTVENQARKQSDLEEYIDSLLMKILSTNPQLLQKNTAEGQVTTGGFNLSKGLGLGLW